MGVVDSREHLTSYVTRHLIPHYSSSIILVQKARRASERAKKRVAKEQVRENGAREEGESGNQVEGRAPKRARVAIGAPRRSRRHV